MKIKDMLYILLNRQNYWFKVKYQRVDFGSYSWLQCTRYGNFISFNGNISSRDTGALAAWQEKIFSTVIPEGFRPYDVAFSVRADRSENVGLQVKLYENGNIGLQTRFAKVNEVSAGVNFAFNGIAII